MSINSILSIENKCKQVSAEHYPATGAHRSAFELGWTQSAFASAMHQVEALYGEEALLRIFEAVGINPVYTTAD
jgi:hypothetical protein